MKARRLPIEVECIKYEGFIMGISRAYIPQEIIDFFGENVSEKIIINYDNLTLKIRTLEGNMNVREGDIIIKGVEGEFYPCKPDIFIKTYELIK